MRAILCLILVGCATGVSDPMDGGIDSPSHNVAGGLCCQITENDNDSSLWNFARFECSLDSGVLFSNVPFVCDRDNPMPCTDERCVVGMSCQGFNGFGVILPCFQGVDQ